MKQLSTPIIDNDDLRNFKKNEIKVEKVSEECMQLIKDLIDLPEHEKQSLINLLSFRNPQTGELASLQDIREYLADLPKFVITIAGQLQAQRRKKENLESTIKKEEYNQKKNAEQRIKDFRLKEKSEGIRKEIGQITIDQIQGEMILHKDYDNIETLQIEKENVENKIFLLETTLNILIYSRRQEIEIYTNIEMNT